MRRGAAAAARWSALLLAAALFLLPFYLLVRNGLATREEITSPHWTFWPAHPRWENITELLSATDVPFARSLLNSLVIAVLQTAGSLVLCAAAGYGLARIPYRHSGKVLGAVVATLLVPTSVTFVPSFVLVSSLGWLSDLRGLVVPGLFSALNAVLFRQFFLDFPADLEDAGRIDGLGRWGVFRRIVLPNSTGFLAAIGAITFIGSWNSFLWPLVIAQDSSSWTVQVALSALLTAQNPQLNLLFAAAALSILPIVLLFAGLQRFLVRGVTETGVNG
ncbi:MULTISPECIES: carbohydrate ABC transporter permease [unclassified Saccharopolyspora]|uniref:carbohydrate ABC transporter permease n=1 Tax=unclassified Saccharopolyspora TaxID=2646250 RepID=UPI001CD62822|nr:MULTISPECIES: carbohydrate ABC transporter permease [unclassified Saccharopolyspora]MCA1194233.1 carbohydrate ABC transporter permease [Saccharopolyspora sp. 6V]MCA1224696.1 carbohydrate ABC transporter permease [Saccharopolyspora sp. 6M]MCA1279377.1 carbohydrate ABC transporter permease [Saccharopolyspora sp. 7B]